MQNDETEIKNAHLTEPAEQKQQRKIHLLLVLVFFQTLVIIGLFIAIVYKFIEISNGL